MILGFRDQILQKRAATLAHATLLLVERIFPEPTDRHHDSRELVSEGRDTSLGFRGRLVLPQKAVEAETAGVVVRIALRNLGAGPFGDPSALVNARFELLDLALGQEVSLDLNQALNDRVAHAVNL